MAEQTLDPPGPHSAIPSPIPMQTAAYYFPNFHVDPLNEAVHGPGWTEWELMKCAHPRFPGHEQPKVPLWGYGDEAAPEVMAQKIDAAADHGVDAFIFDWYWYGQPFLERALTSGYLRAPNRNRLKFALMWANHDWRNFHPASRTQPYPVSHIVKTNLSTVGEVWDYIIANFLTREEYWRVDGKPYFSIYAMNRFIIQMGGIQAAAEAIAGLVSDAELNEENIMPEAFNPKVAEVVAAAVKAHIVR